MKGSNEEPTSISTSTSPPRTWAHQLPNPSTQVAEATSAGSRADYSCYTIRRRKNDEILAVVIETKMDKSSQDALAQVYPFT